MIFHSRMKSLLLSFFLLLHTLQLQAQDTINKRRLIPLLAVSGVAYTAGLVGLSELWYKDHARSGFHFFNDWHEWKQVDKTGHFTTTAVETMYYYQLFKWSGLSSDHAMFYSAFTGIILQAPIEVFDGFSKFYGASVADFSFNTAGALFIFSQYKFWREIKIQPKFSFHTTGFASQRPTVLGKDIFQQILKDYNGQTYWFSFNLYHLLRKDYIPKIIQISLGYGAENMVFSNDDQNVMAGYKPKRQFYISLDLDLTKIKTHNKFLRTILFNLNFIHIPFPAVEFSERKIKFHPLYF